MARKKISRFNREAMVKKAQATRKRNLARAQRALRGGGVLIPAEDSAPRGTRVERIGSKLYMFPKKRK